MTRATFWLMRIAPHHGVGPTGRSVRRRTSLVVGRDRFVGLADGPLFHVMTETWSKPPQCGSAADIGPSAQLAAGLGAGAFGTPRQRPNVPTGSLTDKIAGSEGSHGAAVSWPYALWRSIMQFGAISPSAAATEPPPLLLVGEISHRVLNEYSHAIMTLALARDGTA